MSTLLVAVIFGIGTATFIWTKLARSTGNADPKQTVVAAGAAGLVAAFLFYSVFKWILHIG